MLKEIKYSIFVLVIFLFLFLIGRYYFSDINKKNSYRSLKNVNEKINIYAKKLPILDDDTKNIILESQLDDIRSADADDLSAIIIQESSPRVQFIFKNVELTNPF